MVKTGGVDTKKKQELLFFNFPQTHKCMDSINLLRPPALPILLKSIHLLAPQHSFTDTDCLVHNNKFSMQRLRKYIYKKKKKTLRTSTKEDISEVSATAHLATQTSERYKM